jgi:CBS domain containing-hemolysin-like protein
MNELHKSGQSSFPVVDGKPDQIVGVVYVHDLLETTHGGKISSVMKRDVQYVHEDFSLLQVLQAFYKTNQHIFIVVNSFEEFVGIVSIDEVLAQLVGHPIGDESEDYADGRAVAQALAHQDHLRHDEVAKNESEETEE